MSTNNNNLTYKSVFRFAAKSTRQHAKRLWLISHVLSPKQLREIEYLCHSYLRWVDDFIDHSKEPIEIKKKFLNTQTQYFEQLKNWSDVAPKCLEEACLYFFIKKCKELQMPHLITNAKEIFSSFEIDLERLEPGNYLTKPQQSEYVKRIHKGMFDFIYQLLMRKQSENGKYVGTFYWHVNTLRDLKEDFQSGIINITKEEIEELKVQPSLQLTDPNLKFFIKYKVGIIEELFWKEAQDLHFMPFKVKLFWSAGYILIIFIINRIVCYDYQLKGMHNNSIIIEIKVLVKSIIKIIITYYKVFIHFKLSQPEYQNIK